jgi:hypothetical protein
MSQYHELIEVTEVQKEQALEVHRKNLAETRRLQDELAQIDSLRAPAQQDEATIGARQILGADGLWNGWLLRKRADILQQTAMAKARELNSLDIARTAFARAEAAQELDRIEREELRQKKLKDAANYLDDLGVMRRFD